MDRIGVRELRQNASQYLARVAGGETLEISDRGRPIALLVPLRIDPWEALVSSGRVVVADTGADLLDELPTDYDIDASRAVRDQRADER